LPSTPCCLGCLVALVASLPSLHRCLHGLSSHALGLHRPCRSTAVKHRSPPSHADITRARLVCRAEFACLSIHMYEPSRPMRSDSLPMPWSREQHPLLPPEQSCEQHPLLSQSCPILVSRADLLTVISHTREQILSNCPSSHTREQQPLLSP